MNSDRIEKTVLLRAPLDRVWQAISNADEFGQWFGVRFDAPFVAGTSVTGILTPTTVDAAVAASQQPYAGLPDVWDIVAVEPPRRLAFRWHPFGPESGIDCSTEPTTLVEFTLTEADEGVVLNVVESGFDAIPAHRRRSAFEANSEGWAAQTRLVSAYLALGQAMGRSV